jgi:predicted transcriptional regulator
VSDLPAGVRGFLREHVFSASQLEVLLLLRDCGPLSVPEVAGRTALPPGSLAPWLDAFTARGLLVREGDRYRCAPADDRLTAQLDEVAETWQRRKTTMTRYIYASAQDPLVRFADAFRLRRADPPKQQEP